MRIHALQAVVIFLLCSNCFADGTCYQWQSYVGGVSSHGGAWSSSASAAVDSLISTYCSVSNANAAVCEGTAYCNATGSNSMADGYCSVSFSYTGVAVGAFPAFTVTGGDDAYKLSSTGAVTHYAFSPVIQSRVNPEGCPNCPAVGTVEQVTGTGTSIPSQLCKGGCLQHAGGVGVVIGSLWVSDFYSNGVACGASTSGNGVASGGADGSCVQSGSVVGCVDSSAGSNCTTLNGDQVCPNNVPNGCVKYASGATACASSEAAVPSGDAPNDGTANVPAVPDAQASTTNPSSSTTTTNVTNYYTSTTVSGSLGSSGGSGSSSSASGSGGGGGSASSGSSSSGSASGTCDDTGSNCQGTLPSLDTADSVGSLGSAFVAGVQSSPLYTAVSGISTSIPSGTCPSVPITVFSHSYDLMTGGCQIWSENVEPVLSVIMLAVWSIIGIIIVLRA